MNKTTFVTIFLIGLLEIPLAFAESDVSPLIGPNQVITYSGIAGGQSEMQANCELQTVINESGSVSYTAELIDNALNSYTIYPASGSVMTKGQAVMFSAVHQMGVNYPVKVKISFTNKSSDNILLTCTNNLAGFTWGGD